MELKFKRDTSFRKQFFTPESFAHPAKMDAQLLLWIVERYTKPGEVILDPMAGMGTTMLACTLGRNVVLVELEEKFCKMCQDNWEIVKTKPQLGSTMGNCQIIQGDARQLEGLLVDKCIFSPPYAEAHDTKNLGVGDGDRADLRAYSWLKEDNPDNIANLPYGQIDKIVTSPPFGEAQSGGGIAQKGYQGPKHGPTDLVGKRSYMPENIGDQDNISNLPYGNIDSIITSPPYEASDVSQTHMTSNKRGDPGDPNYRPSWKRKLTEGYAESKRPYHEVDSIITSPPYEEGGGHSRGQATNILGEKGIYLKGAGMYSESKENIGEMRGNTYLEAMLQVYQQCYKVLKPRGLMILVTKNFIREKQVIRLDEDTIKLCEQAGFSFVERHERELTSLSFWRRIYHDKFPEVEQIKSEDILVFQRSKGER